MPFFRIISALFAIALSASFALKPKEVTSEYRLLRVTTKRYQSSALVQMNVEKVVKSELMGSETKYIGKIDISSGRFRWENTTPEKSLLVFDGKTIWSEQSPPAEFPGKVQVAVAKVDKKNRSQILISSLLGKSTIFENFKVLKEDRIGAETVYLIEPKTKEINIDKITLTINTKEKTLIGISYKDDVGNLTEMKFSNIEFFKKNSRKELFNYTPPKGAQVTNL